MRGILDPQTAVIEEGGAATVVSPDDLVRRVQDAPDAVIALTDVTVTDTPAPGPQLRQLMAAIPDGKLGVVDGLGDGLAQGFYAGREDVHALYAASVDVRVTAYPIALRRGIEARSARPSGRWMFVDVAGRRLWLSVWEDDRLLQWRPLSHPVDLGSEIARSLVQLPSSEAGTPVHGFATDPEALEVLRGEGVRATLWEGVSPALLGLESLPQESQFWLPELLQAREEKRLRRRRVLQRSAAVVATVLAVGVLAGAQWLKAEAEGRIVRAEVLVHQIARAREAALHERTNVARQMLNRAGLQAWTTALASLTSADRPMFKATLVRGQWQVEMQTPSYDAAMRFAAALGPVRSDIRPRTVHEGLGWVVTATLGDTAWIGWPSR